MNELDELVADIRSSAKYKHVTPGLIRSLGATELSKRGGYKEAVKATRNKLHQVGGAYLDRPPRYGQYLSEMRSAYQSGGISALRPICTRLMSSHASTHERLPVLDQLFTAVFEHLPPIRSIMDIACGFNPLALPWMPIPADASYDAIDIYEDMMEFLHEFLLICGHSGNTRAQNVLDGNLTEHKVDLAFVLKSIPCLEQVDKQAGIQLLNRINADFLLISFPVASLGGRSKGMVATYEAHFMEILKPHAWTWRRFEFATELAFLVSRMT